MTFKKLIIAGAILCAACASEQAPDTDVSEPPIIVEEEDWGPPEIGGNFDEAEKAACEADGGSYEIGGLGGQYYCVRTYSDGGKTCFDERDCEGICIASNQADFDPAGQSGAQWGKCSYTDSPFGCYAEVRNGVARPVLCVD